MKCKEWYPRPCIRSTKSTVRANGSLTGLVTPLAEIKGTSALTARLTTAQCANLTLPTRKDWAVEMKNLLLRFMNDDAGATAVEYGLIAAGIAVAIISVVNGLGSKLNGKFDSISTQLK